MNLAFRWPTIFWNCACLITDSGGAEEQEQEEAEIVDIYEAEDFEEFEYEDAPDRKTKKKKHKSNNYDKIATAIGKMRAEGIKITPPDINTAQYTFYPDANNNQILFGLRGLLNIGDDIIEMIIENRPYISPRDFINKVKPKKTSMISLIKAGAFDSMMERKLCMVWYLWEICDKKQRLTLQNLPSLSKYGLLPTETEEQVLAQRVYEFNRYLKTMCKFTTEKYRLDDRAVNFLIELNLEDLLICQEDGLIELNVKKWDKIYQSYMDIFRNWLNINKTQILQDLNLLIFKEEWDKYAKGSISSWEMEVMCYYYHEHELINVNQERYGIVNFEDLPEDPIVENSYYKNGKLINLFKLSKICGTCIAKDKSKGTATILTTSGVVTVKFRKEYFAMFDKQISEKREDGTKKVIEKSWFNRGSMIMVQGIRSGDTFIPKKYASSGGHQLYKITDISPTGELVLRNERFQGEEDV